MTKIAATMISILTSMGKKRMSNLCESEEDDRVMCELAVHDLDQARRDSRQKKYKEEKEKLISEMVDVTRSVNQSKAMEIGAKVQTRKKDRVTKCPKKGVITDKVYAADSIGGGGEKKKYSWRVRLESGENELFVSQQLKRQDSGGGNTDYVWKVVKDHFPDVELEEYDQCGVAGYDFEQLERYIDADDSKDYTYAFAELFQKLWPGSSKRELRKMNATEKESNDRFSRSVKELTEEEWWHGIGIILVAGPTDYGRVEKL